MYFLTPYIVIGSKSIFSLIKNHLRYNIHLKSVSFILVLYFIFNVGFVNYITKDKPISPPLDMNRMKKENEIKVKYLFYGPYIPEQDYFSTIWLSTNINTQIIIYSDYISKWHVLHSYGTKFQKLYDLLNSTILLHGEYIYLNQLNSVEGIIVTHPRYQVYFTSDISSLLDKNNKIYSNGDSEIYLGP